MGADKAADNVLWGDIVSVRTDWPTCLFVAREIQELSYRKQIARQLRTQYAEGIVVGFVSNYKNDQQTLHVFWRLQVWTGDECDLEGGSRQQVLHTRRPAHRTWKVYAARRSA